MITESFDYYEQAQKTAVKNLLLGTIAFSLFFISICASIYYFLPETGYQQGGATEDVKVSDENPLSNEEVYAYTYREDDDEKAANASNIQDIGLMLYRQPQTRAAVEGFYYQVTGDRKTTIAILDAAEEFNIPLSLAFALAHTESKFKATATHTNKNGSVDKGLFQLNDKSFPKLTDEQFYDPKTSAHYGLSHLNYCLETAGNDVAALAMYNAGTTKVRNNNTPHSTLNYIAEISAYRSQIDEDFAKDVLVFFDPSINYTEKMVAVR